MVGEIVENLYMLGNRDQNLGKSERCVRLETAQNRRIETVRELIVLRIANPSPVLITRFDRITVCRPVVL